MFALSDADFALNGHPSPYVSSIVEGLSGSCKVSLETVFYEFQGGENQMMLVRPLM
jgi:hypothetical protein